MAFNENTRVKIPAILQLCRLGYNYISGYFGCGRAKYWLSETVIFNELMAPIHNRMPVILPREVEQVWLDQGILLIAIF